MFDCHYDLLTYILMHKDNLKEVKKHCKNIFKKSIKGGIFNLFYMSPREMKEELNIDYENINIINNLKTVNYIIKEENLIPNGINYVYGIEGLDYLKEIKDIDIIYDLGVRSVNIVWNNDNKFGGGIKGDEKRGLTYLGEKLINKLVDKSIAIDLSHANEKTFYNIIEICTNLKNKGKNPKVFVSHSNVKKLCNNKRNLTDEQILRIKRLNGIVGVVGVKPFCLKEQRVKIINKRYENAYIEHIMYLKKYLRWSR